MKHIDDGTLRRLLDEPFAVSAADRLHAESCQTCILKLNEISESRNYASAALATPAPPVDVSGARRRLVTATQPAARHGVRASRHVGRRRPRKRFGLIAVAVSATAVIALGMTPARSLGKDFLSIFQPQQFAAISITAGELRTLPDLHGYGTLKAPEGVRTRSADSVAAAESAVGTHVLTPASLPNGVSAAPRIEVVPGSSSSFTFSKTQATQRHPDAPPMPLTVDGSTITLSTAPAVLTVYGAKQEIPELVVGQTAAPVIRSSGADLSTIEGYALHLPGVSPALAAEIRAVGNPAATLPIPIPENWALAQHVTVDGHQGLFIGDDTGIASGIIWRDGNMIYGVAGALTESQVLDTASSLR